MRFGRRRMCCCISLCDVTIGLGIPGVPIQTIGNAKDTRMTLKQDLIEAPTMVERLDFLGITVRDGRHYIGIYNTGFHPVHIPPEFQSIRNEDAARVQPSLVEDRDIPAPLVL